MNYLHFFEETHYPVHELENVLGHEFLSSLQKHRICTRVTHNQMKFQLVGFFVHETHLCFVLPKYVAQHQTHTQLQQKMKHILNVLAKYGDTYNLDPETDFLSIDLQDEITSTFALAKYLIEDFLHHGYYSKFRSDLTLNGEGETLWGKTVEEIDPYVVKGRPFYFDTYTNEAYSDESFIIKQIHKWAVNQCFTQYGTWLGYSNLNVNDFNMELSQLGSIEFLLASIDHELNVTFVDRQVNLLRSLKAFIEQTNSFTQNKVDLYGTTNFKNLWEKICGFVFSNQYLDYEKYIPKPTWHIFGHAEGVQKDTFIPDVIRTYQSNDLAQDYFLVLDAKYYNIRYSKHGLYDQPSVNDVAKQLLYLNALEDITVNKVTRNYFLLPTESVSDTVFEVFGKASLDFVRKEPVILVYLCDDRVYNMFLENKTFSIAELDQLEHMVQSKCKEGLI